jgi:hypothetical protein
LSNRAHLVRIRNVIGQDFTATGNGAPLGNDLSF